MRANNGFTLIELMFVLAIIGILSSIALPQYNAYIAKSQHSAGLADISSGKLKLEILLDLDASSTVNLAFIGLPASTSNCDISVNTVATASSIICTLKGSAKVAGKKITLSRNNVTGKWLCTSEAEPVYSGSSCQGV